MISIDEIEYFVSCRVDELMVGWLNLIYFVWIRGEICDWGLNYGNEIRDGDWV